MSWDAVKEKLKIIIDHEDKNNPLNDDEIVEKLKDQGIEALLKGLAAKNEGLCIVTTREKVDDIKQYYTRHYERHIARTDATLRAILERHLLTLDQGLH